MCGERREDPRYDGTLGIGERRRNSNAERMAFINLCRKKRIYLGGVVHSESLTLSPSATAAAPLSPPLFMNPTENARMNP